MSQEHITNQSKISNNSASLTDINKGQSANTTFQGLNSSSSITSTPIQMPLNNKINKKEDISQINSNVINTSNKVIQKKEDINSK